MIAIIDYDAGNIKSVEKAFQALGQKVVITRDKNVILNADGVVLPGHLHLRSELVPAGVCSSNDRIRYDPRYAARVCG